MTARYQVIPHSGIPKPLRAGPHRESPCRIAERLSWHTRHQRGNRLNPSDIRRHNTRTASQPATGGGARGQLRGRRDAPDPNSKNRSNLAVFSGTAAGRPPLWKCNFGASHSINARICTRSSQLPRLACAACESEVDSARVSQNRGPTLYSIQGRLLVIRLTAYLDGLNRRAAPTNGRGKQNWGVSGVQFGISARSHVCSGLAAVGSVRLRRRQGGRGR